MSQKYIDWELIEAKNFGPYKYEILRVETEDHTFLWKGIAIFASGDQWAQHEDINPLRFELIHIGQFNS
jgi:hypothetical protein